jgi:hypothetical protein
MRSSRPGRNPSGCSRSTAADRKGLPRVEGRSVHRLLAAGRRARPVHPLRQAQDFPGKAALLAEKQRGVSKRFVTLKVDANGADAPYMSTLWHDGQVVGETTSGAWGYRVGGSVALGMLRADLARARHRARGRDLSANAAAGGGAGPIGPLWDPGERPAAGLTTGSPASTGRPGRRAPAISRRR